MEDTKKNYLSDVIIQASKEGLMYVLTPIIFKYEKMYGKIDGYDKYHDFVKDVATAYEQHKIKYEKN